MNVNELEWMRDMHKKDTSIPPVCVDGEIVYTVFLRDFFKMPDVNFLEVAQFDSHVKALLN
jgi:hypothetical protein